VTYRLGIDAVMAVAGTSTVTIIRQGRFVETRHITKPMVLTDWPGLIAEIASDLSGPVAVDVDTRGVGRAVYEVLHRAGISVCDTRPDLDAVFDEKRSIRGLGQAPKMRLKL